VFTVTKRSTTTWILLCQLIVPVSYATDFGGLLKNIISGKETSTPSAAALSNSDVIAGLKEALSNGAQKAISNLGTSDGYLGNPKVRIPLPDKLQKIESVLRALKQARYADEFIATMNHAAEQAVPEAQSIVADAIRQMSVKDAKNILNGPDDAATQYFKGVGEKPLTQRMLPIIKEATSKTGVTSAYKNAISQAGIAGKLFDTSSLDIDKYVTTKALDGLFIMIAAEEKRIRENPLARGSELLKKVFGSVGS